MLMYTVTETLHSMDSLPTEVNETLHTMLSEGLEERSDENIPD